MVKGEFKVMSTEFKEWLKVVEIAEILGLSKVSVYNRVKALNQDTLHSLLKIEKGVKYYDRKILELLEPDKFKEFKANTEDSLKYDEIATDLESLNLKGDYINTLKEQLKIKDSQLEEKDKQINELHRLVENSQILLKQSQEMQLKEDPILLEEHFEELDKKIEDIKVKMENKKNQKKGLFKFFGKEKCR